MADANMTTNANGSNTTSCNVGELIISNEENRTLFCLDRGQSIGLAFAAETGFFSMIAVVVALAVIARHIIRYHQASGKWRVTNKAIEVYMISLLVADLVQAIGAILDVKWVNEGKVYTGSFCTAQGVVQQIGETAVAITTLAIAFHTFIAVWWEKGGHALWTARLVVLAIWLFIILMSVINVAIHDDKSNLYDVPTPYWCWVGSHYMPQRIAGEYIWLWMALFFSVILYIPLCFWSNGNVTVDQHTWWKFYLHKSRSLRNRDLVRRQAYNMIAYPLVYAILVAPLSVIRWIGFYQENTGARTNRISPAATITAVTIFGLSGTLNVLLLFLTRGNTFLFGRELPVRATSGPPAQLTVSVQQIVNTDGRTYRERKDDEIEMGRASGNGASDSGWEESSWTEYNPRTT